MFGEKEIRYRFWLIPLLLTIHNIEEALTMPRWVMHNQQLLQSTLFIFRYIHFSPAQLYLSLISVTLISLSVVLACTVGELTAVKIRLALILQAIIGWNAVAPHLLGVVALGIYNPGAITAAFINVPFSLYLFQWSLDMRIISGKDMRRVLLLAFVIYLPVVYANHLLGEGMSRLF